MDGKNEKNHRAETVPTVPFGFFRNRQRLKIEKERFIHFVVLQTSLRVVLKACRCEQ